jgi:hypothetical protein
MFLDWREDASVAEIAKAYDLPMDEIEMRVEAARLCSMK